MEREFFGNNDFEEFFQKAKDEGSVKMTDYLEVLIPHKVEFAPMTILTRFYA